MAYCFASFWRRVTTAPILLGLEISVCILYTYKFGSVQCLAPFRLSVLLLILHDGHNNHKGFS
jgi:hypothetical protein